MSNPPERSRTQSASATPRASRTNSKSVSASNTPGASRQGSVLKVQKSTSQTNQLVNTLSIPHSVGVSRNDSVGEVAVDELQMEGLDPDDISAQSQNKMNQLGTNVKRIISTVKALDIGVEEEKKVAPLPTEFKMLDVYKEIVDEQPPIVELTPVFKAEEKRIEEIVVEVNKRLERNPTQKAFVDETKKLLLFCMQERRMRKQVQENLKLKEREVNMMLETFKRDPRIPKIIQLADHWRQEKDQADERVTLLLTDINSVTLDMKSVEGRMAALQKKYERMEQQLMKKKACESEKETLEELVIQRDKELLDANEQMDLMRQQAIIMENMALNKEQEFKVKLENAPDRNAGKLAALGRELEMITIEKDVKIQEARDLHDNVNSLTVENLRCNDRIKMLMLSAKSLKVRWRNLETKYQALTSQNKGLQRTLEKSMTNQKRQETTVELLERENLILKNQISTMQSKLKAEQTQGTTYQNRISQLQFEISEMKATLKEDRHIINQLKNDTNYANKEVKKTELQMLQVRKMQLNETQKVSALQRKLKASVTHIQNALVNLNIMSVQTDKTEEWLKHLNSNLYRCRTDNARNLSNIKYLYSLLESNQELFRLQTRENDALVMSKNRLVDALTYCSNSKKKLTDEVIQLQSIKTAVDDAELAHQFMLDFLRVERDGAIRNAKKTENDLVIMGRDQLAKIAKIANCNAETSKMKLKISDLNAQSNSQKKEIYNMSVVLKKAEQNTRQVEQWCRSLIHQRDLFGTKLLQRKTEAELMEIKMMTLEQMLQQANNGYSQSCNDVSILKKEIQNLRGRLRRLHHMEATCRELRSEVASLQKAMCLETNKRVALENIGPQQIHPRRDMMNQNPHLYELLMKMQKVQKMAILKASECIAKEKEIAIRNDHIRALQESLCRYTKINTGPELNELRQLLRQKSQQVKSLTAEVRMLHYHQDVYGNMSVNQTNELGIAKVELASFRRSKSFKKSSSTSFQNSLNWNQSNKTTVPKKPTNRQARSDNFS